MKVINVVRAFTLNLKGKVTEFEKGLHTVEAEVADHWFVKAFSTVVSDVVNDAGKVKADVKTVVPDAEKVKADVKAVVTDAEKAVDAAKVKPAGK